MRDDQTMSKLLTFAAGRVLGKLRVLTRADNNHRGLARWLCECDCGKTTVVEGYRLQSGVTRSCGCLRGDTHRRHGKRQTATYKAWLTTKQRCSNPRNQDYRLYGGRGVKMCERWLKFANFLADMGERPNGLTLDRFPNNDGNYEPGNCRWATQKQQAATRRRPKTWRPKED